MNKKKGIARLLEAGVIYREIRTLLKVSPNVISEVAKAEGLQRGIGNPRWPQRGCEQCLQTFQPRTPMQHKP